MNLALLLSAIAMTAAPPAQQPTPRQEKPDKTVHAGPAVDAEKLTAFVDKLANQVVDEEGVPGMSIAVAHAGEIMVAKGYGYADAGRALPAREDTRYGIGTLTRQFTAVAVLQLVDAEKLALDDEVSKLLPGFPSGERKITLKHLLANTSGIPGLKKLVARHPEVVILPMDEKKFFSLFADVPFDFEPGAGFELESANYVLLSMILAKTSGTSHAEYVMKNVVQPADLQQTTFCPLKERPVGFFAADCKVEADTQELEIPLAAAPDYSTQSLCSTVTDLVRWQEALVGRVVFSQRASRLIMSPTELPEGRSTDYGYAVKMDKLEDFKRYSHSGGVGGFRVCLVYYSLPKITIAIMANCATAPVDRIERDIAKLVLGLPVPDGKALALAPEDAERCAGLYQIATTQVHVEARDDSLWYVPANAPRLRLVHQGQFRFAFENEPEATVEFHVKDGLCGSFTLTRDGFQTVGKRME